jgi:D-lactate dehydrogenase (cytochrome)
LRPDPAELAGALSTLTARFGDRLATAPATRAQHGHGTTWIANQPPDAVVFPQDAGEVQAIVRICATHRVPVIAFGTGTSLEGHVNAPYGGVSVDLRDMNRILAVNAADLDCEVEPGVTRKQLNQHLRDQGLFFPLDPGADASLGGMAATCCSGTNAVRYGTMRHNVLSLDVVLANGERISTGTRARKSAAGYDLTRLIIGSEGTLGIITRLALRLHGIPEAVVAGICPFPSVEACCNAAIATIQAGLPVARIELLDALQVRACNAYSNLTLPETPLLCVEFHGSPQGVAEQSARFGEIAAEAGGGPFDWASRPEDRSRLWQARHDAYWAGRALRPGTQAVATDVCVPISQLAACVVETQRDLAESRLIAPILGHVGDGNFHLTLLVDMADADEVARAQALHRRLVERALVMQGTSTGEHGVGQGKVDYLLAERGAAGLAAMAAVKAALDPLGIMNPGKILASIAQPRRTALT